MLWINKPFKRRRHKKLVYKVQVLMSLECSERTCLYESWQHLKESLA